MIRNLIIFILLILFCPNLFAATLTPNTVPYVCQGGSNPQLCSSSLTTDSNGNVSGGLGSWAPKSVSVPYQATTDGFVLIYCGGSGYGSYVTAYIDTDSNNPPTTVRSYNNLNYGGYTQGSEVMNAFSPVRKNDYYEGNCTGDRANQSSSMYFISIGK